MSAERDYDALLDILIAKGPKLRDAGITSFSVDGITVQLAPPEPPAPPPNVEQHVPKDPLDDPFLYPGGRVPSIKREDRDA